MRLTARPVNTQTRRGPVGSNGWPLEPLSTQALSRDHCCPAQGTWDQHGPRVLRLPPGKPRNERINLKCMMFASLPTIVASRKSVFTACLHLGHWQVRAFRRLGIGGGHLYVFIPQTLKVHNRASHPLLGVRQRTKHNILHPFSWSCYFNKGGLGQGRHFHSWLRLKPCLWCADLLSSFSPKNQGWMPPTQNSGAFLLLTCRISVASGFTNPL